MRDTTTNTLSGILNSAESYISGKGREEEGIIAVRTLGLIDRYNEKNNVQLHDAHSK